MHSIPLGFLNQVCWMEACLLWPISIQSKTVISIDGCVLGHFAKSSLILKETAFSVSFYQYFDRYAVNCFSSY